jgi:hypothetical protein
MIAGRGPGRKPWAFFGPRGRPWINLRSYHLLTDLINPDLLIFFNIHPLSHSDPLSSYTIEGALGDPGPEDQVPESGT